MGAESENTKVGEPWIQQKTDIDIFVTPLAAASVRTHLVTHGMMMTGLSDSTMQGYGDVPVHADLRSDLHHVEEWSDKEKSARLYIEWQLQMEDPECEWGYNFEEYGEPTKMTEEELARHMPEYIEKFEAECEHYGAIMLTAGS